MLARLVIGLNQDKALAQSVARLLKAPLHFAQINQFAAGEHSVVCAVPAARDYIIAANVSEDPSTLLHLLFIQQALRLQHTGRIILLAPWIAYGRQDRMAKPGEAPGGIVIGNLLGQAFDRIYTFDAHSERFVSAFQKRLVNVYADPSPFKSLRKVDVVVAPDKGAQARASVVAKAIRKPCLFIDKKRDGANVTCCLSTDMDLQGKIALLVDDMADSGGTLIAAAEVLRESGAKNVYAFIPHAINLKKLKERSKGILTKVETAFDHAGNKLDAEHVRLLVNAYKKNRPSENT